MRAPLALLLALAACAPASRTPGVHGAPPAFDAQAWLARARPAAVETFDGLSADDPRLGPARAASDVLDATVGWKRSCDTTWDPRTQQETLLPYPDGGPPTRGAYIVTDLGPAESVVVLECSANPYQTYTVAVHIVGGRAALLRAPAVDAAGAPFGPPRATYTEPEFEAGRQTFAATDRGIGDDCGIAARYRIMGLGSADLIEARARACGASSAPTSGEWPIVFPRP